MTASGCCSRQGSSAGSVKVFQTFQELLVFPRVHGGTSYTPATSLHCALLLRSPDAATIPRTAGVDLRVLGVYGLGGGRGWGNGRVRLSRAGIAGGLVRQSRDALFGRSRNLVSLNSNDVKLVNTYLNYSIYLSIYVSIYQLISLHPIPPTHQQPKREIYFAT